MAGPQWPSTPTSGQVPFTTCVLGLGGHPYSASERRTAGDTGSFTVLLPTHFNIWEAMA